MNELNTILEAIEAAGGNPLMVGGCVRDSIMGIASKDIDVEVYGLPSDKLVACLRRFGKVDIVGASFGVIKLHTNSGNWYDFNLPRRDSKIGPGHKDFTVVVDSNLTPMEAAARRDFTMNSMMMDKQGNILDPFDGQVDMANHLLHPTSEAFQEDALRVLRGFQFAGRFKMTPSFDLMHIAREMLPEYKHLAVERIWGEWEKWALKSTHPSYGLTYLMHTGWDTLYPAIYRLEFFKQDPIWHPEGGVFAHTAYVCDEMAAICERENITHDRRLVLMFAALCHDFGKPSCTFTNEAGRIVSPGHDKAGVPIAREFLESIGCRADIIAQVLPLVAEHMAHISVNNEEMNIGRFVRRLAVRLHPAMISDLDLLVEADMSGRPPLPKGKHPLMGKILEQAKIEAIEGAKPKPILMGRHLIELGYEPGPQFKIVLDECYQLQLDGVISTLEDAIQWGNDYLYQLDNTK